MTHIPLLLIIIILEIQLLFAVLLRVIPEKLFNASPTGNFTANCDIECIWDSQSESIDGVLHIVMNNRDFLRSFRYSKLSTVNIVGSNEGSHYHNLISKQLINKYFTASALIDRNSDIPWLLLANYKEVQNIAQPVNTLNKALFAASNCKSKNNREKLVKVIMKYIIVDSLSDCLKNGKWPLCSSQLCTKIEVAAQYKLLLAFENGNLKGYVTEKISAAYEAGVLPVYYGTDEIKTLAPKGSYIDISDFDTFDAAGLYLKKVLENETLYNSYFEWKQKPLDKDLLDLEPIFNKSIHCRVCKFVDTIKRGLVWDHIRQIGVPADKTQRSLNDNDHAIQFGHGHNYEINYSVKATMGILIVFILLILLIRLLLKKNYLILNKFYVKLLKY